MTQDPMYREQWCHAATKAPSNSCMLHHWLQLEHASTALSTTASCDNMQDNRQQQLVAKACSYISCQAVSAAVESVSHEQKTPLQNCKNLTGQLASGAGFDAGGCWQTQCGL